MKLKWLFETGEKKGKKKRQRKEGRKCAPLSEQSRMSKIEVIMIPDDVNTPI
jgi:hypothetical protein